MYTWKLTIGDHSWLADCYIENLDQVYIGDHVCISQRAMVLTGSHDYKKTAFDLITKPVTIQTGAWICANTTVGPGVWVGAGSVLVAGSVATSDLAPNTIYQGNPARIKRKRY
jgi:putative colanic acid biosynthesis acetyltransferase WcaF